MFGCNKEDKQTDDETFEEEIVVLKAQISKLTVENESYKQQLHELSRKFENNVTMQAELVESNEMLEKLLSEHKATVARKINEVEERFVAETTSAVVFRDQISMIKATFLQSHGTPQGAGGTHRRDGGRASHKVQGECGTLRKDQIEQRYAIGIEQTTKYC